MSGPRALKGYDTNPKSTPIKLEEPIEAGGRVLLPEVPMTQAKQHDVIHITQSNQRKAAVSP